MRLGWRQEDLAARSGRSQSVVSRVELGQVSVVSLATLEDLARVLGAHLVVRLVWRGADADRLLDAAHASLVEAVVSRLAAHGWVAAPETTFSVYGERGSIDVLARHSSRRGPLVVEVKTAIGDVQELIATHDRKARLAPKLGSAGWPDPTWRHGPPARADRLLLVAGTRTARRRVAEHAATFLAAYPERDAVVRRWLAAPPTDLRPFAGLLFVTPTRGAGSMARRRVRQRSSSVGSRSADRRPTAATRVDPT
jgi:transcriptional regulator with XRE-family HTH domain